MKKYVFLLILFFNIWNSCLLNLTQKMIVHTRNYEIKFNKYMKKI